MCRLKLELRGVLENAIVRDERDAEAERGGGDPAIGIVLPLAERVTNLHAVGAEARVGGDELVAGVTTSTAAILASSFRKRASPQPRRSAP